MNQIELNNFRAIIFDLDGTLINSIDDIMDSMNHVLRKHGFPRHDQNTYKEIIGKGIENLVRMAIPSSRIDDDFVSLLVKEMKQEYSRRWLNKTHLYEGIPEMLDIFWEKKYSLNILSNKSHSYVEDIRKVFFDKWSFSFVLGARDNIPKKPDPFSALEIAERLNIPVNEFLFMGDSSVDIQTAKNAGMLPIGVSWGYKSSQSLKDSGAQIVFDHPIQMVKLLS